MNRSIAATMTILATISLAGCSGGEKGEKKVATAKPGTEITVDASDTACAVASTKAAAGPLTFVITNTGTKVTEFYVYGEGQRVIAEAENISPGLQRRLEVTFDKPGTYQTACKPGMTGDGLRGDFTVTS